MCLRCLLYICSWLLSLEFRRELELEGKLLVSRWYLGSRAWVADEGVGVDRGEEGIKA